MKVSTWKNIDVDVEVEVTIVDVLQEFRRHIAELPDADAPTHNENNFGLNSVVLPSLDLATRILGDIPYHIIAKMKDKARREIVLRLTTQLGRFGFVESSR